MLPAGYVRGFAGGSSVTSVIALLAFWVIQATGTAATMMGDDAERWTASELRKLRRHGWRLVNHVMQFYFTFRQEKVHPLQGGFFRRKIRHERRRGIPRENPVVFYPRRVCEVIDTHVRLAAFYWTLHRIRKKVERDPRPYIDPALIPVPAEALQTKPRVDAAA